MPATVVSGKDMVELVTTGKVAPKEDLPATTREKLTLKRSGVQALAKPEPKSEPAPKADGSEKLDDGKKPDVKDVKDGAKPSQDGEKPSAAGDEAEKLPKLSTEREKEVKRIIGNKHRQMKEAQEFAEFHRKRAVTAERRVQELETQLKQGSKPTDATSKDSEPTRAEDSDEPKPENFPNVAAYAKAQIKWEREQERKAQTDREAEEATSKDAERRAKLNEKWQERLVAVMEEEPEFEDVVLKAFGSNGKLANSVLDELQESDLGPQMLIHLARNPEERATFMALNAEKQIKFLGKLEAKLEAKPAAEPEPEPEAKKDPQPKEEPKPTPVKNVSKAPPPTDTSVGTGEPISKNPADMSFPEYRAYMQSQRRATRR